MYVYIFYIVYVVVLNLLAWANFCGKLNIPTVAAIFSIQSLKLLCFHGQKYRNTYFFGLEYKRGRGEQLFPDAFNRKSELTVKDFRGHLLQPQIFQWGN